MHRTLAVFLVALLAVGMAPAWAADRVAYCGSDGLTVQQVDGASSTVIDVDHREATWSPDGLTIYYVDTEGIWSTPADGDAAPRLLVVDPVAGSLDISPDGRHLAFHREGVGGAGVMVLGLDGDDTAQAVTSPGPDTWDADPRWAPDGQSIAFRRLDQTRGRRDVRIIPAGFTTAAQPADGKVLVDVAEFTTLAAPVWEPDGRHLVVSAVRLGGSGRHELFRVAADGSSTTLLAEGGDFDVHSAAVSPEGRYVAYARQCAECTQDAQEQGLGSGVWLADLLTGTRSQLASTPGEERDLGWTADAYTVVWEARHGDSGCHCDISDLHAMGLNDGAPVQLDSALLGPLVPAVSPGVAARLSGPSRVETALAVSREVFDSAPVVVLARADVYADALAGAPLAGAGSGPLLLAPPDALPDAVVTEIRRLGPRGIVLLGDETALSPAVEDRLADLVGDGDLEAVERIGGRTRYETAALVAERLSSDHAYVVQGAAADPARGWPDAVSVAGLAASEAAPLLLTERDRLPEETAAAISRAGLTTVTIVGGTAAVSAAVEEELRGLGVDVERLDGTNRYETSVAVTQLARQRGAATGLVWLATGRNWPDSLSAGPAAAHAGGVLLLADGLDPAGSGATWNWLEQDRVGQAWLVGGPDVLTPEVRVAVERRAAG